MRSDRTFLSMILLAAWLLRFLVAVLSPNVQWPDETYQVLEPAHRLVFGYGVISWEWANGLRSLTPPGLIAAFLLPAKYFDWDADIYLKIIDGALSLLSLSVVWVAFRSGRDRWDSLVAAAPAALWCEMVLFAPHALFDVLATDALIPGLYLANKEQRLVRLTAGVLLAFAVCLRPTLAPPIALGLLLYQPFSAKRWAMLLLGGVTGGLIYGMGDLAQGQLPLSSVFRHLFFNAHAGNNALFGIEPWDAYLTTELCHWGSALPVLALLIAAGAKGHGMGRNGVWIVVAMTILAEYSMIPHKEYRFIYPAIACLMIPMGAGLQRVVTLTERLELGEHASLSRVAVLLFAICSMIAAILPGMADEWRRGAAGITVFRSMAADSTVCGVGFLPEVPMSYMGGYVSLHRSVPFYDKVTKPAVVASSVSDLLAGGNRDDLPPGFDLDRCWDDVFFGWKGAPQQICRYHRTGTCSPPDPAGPRPYGQ